MTKACERCKQDPNGRRSWCHRCGLLLCSDCFNTTNHDHTHHMARQQVMKLPTEEFNWQPTVRPY